MSNPSPYPSAYHIPVAGILLLLGANAAILIAIRGMIDSYGLDGFTGAAQFVVSLIVALLGVVVSIPGAILLFKHQSRSNSYHSTANKL